jgi:hypothetical protein
MRQKRRFLTAFKSWHNTPDSPDHKVEQQAIADTLGALLVLKRDKLGFPDRESD